MLVHKLLFDVLNKEVSSFQGFGIEGSTEVSPFQGVRIEEFHFIVVMACNTVMLPLVISLNTEPFLLVEYLSFANLLGRISTSDLCRSPPESSSSTNIFYD